MLHTKYESSGSSSFRQEDFWKFQFKTYLLTQWPTCATNWNGLKNFDRDHPGIISVKIGQIPISG